MTSTSCSPGCVFHTGLGPVFLGRGTSWTSSLRSTAWGPGCVSRSMARGVHVCVCTHMSPSCRLPACLQVPCVEGRGWASLPAALALSHWPSLSIFLPHHSVDPPHSFCSCSVAVSTPPLGPFLCFLKGTWSFLSLCAPPTSSTLFTAPQQDRAGCSPVVQAQGLCPPLSPSKAPVLFCPMDGDFCPLELLLTLPPRQERGQA